MKSNIRSSKVDWKKLAAIELSQFESDLINNKRWSVEEIGSMIGFSSIDSEFVSVFLTKKEDFKI